MVEDSMKNIRAAKALGIAAARRNLAARCAGRVLEVGTFSLPPLRYETRGFWCDVPKAAQTAADAAGLDFVGGVHAANHALLAIVPMLVLCDAQDVDTEPGCNCGQSDSRNQSFLS